MSKVIELSQGILDDIYSEHKSQGLFMDKKEWQPYVSCTYNELINIATTKPYDQMIITYSQLGNKIGLFSPDWFHLKIAWILYACAEYQNRYYGDEAPLITALVLMLKLLNPEKVFGHCGIFLSF
jgi:hypothetical protein